MNYFLKFKQIWFFLFIGLLINSAPLLAQKKGTTEKPKKEEKVKVAKNGNSAAGIAVQVSGLSREEKNTMASCPVHNKHMGLSDNYRADASDYTPGDHYPFAYQLNYRRYCLPCTKVMSKEAHVEDTGGKASANKATFERCALHNSELKGNGDYDKVSYEKNPSADMPHAKQYLYKNYCTICTKVYKIQHQ